MTWVDYCIAAVALISVLIGLMRGFTREILSLLTWVAAFVFAAWHGGKLAVHLERYISDPALRELAGCALVFLGVLLVGSLLTHLATMLVRDSLFSTSDRMLGGGVGVLRAVLLLLLFMIVAGHYEAQRRPWWKDSMIFPHFTAAAQGLEAMLPQRWLQWLHSVPQPSSPSDS
ncbi:membrane protein required for colicin V production [Solimonas aquatica]|uniref:Membrane protein required for colicin V production n=1 Tax=Solimonas aquatica TaxID=489703 RepID=A0A1H9A0Q5_9GAMM|nr:CvpA family protein [Solimonas aquatica]SEP70081.1 membrane protein required for colicin V production [Solimonas aquatica]